jgi:hypothetical protein
VLQIWITVSSTTESGATGKSFTVEAIDVFTFDANGQNTEHYGVTTRWAR